MPFALSPLYPILDSAYLPSSLLEYERDAYLSWEDRRISRPGDDKRRSALSQVARALANAGVTLMQYRNKREPNAQVERDLTWLRSQAPPSLRIVLNDRFSLVVAGGCDGLHLGQTDLSIGNARTFLGPGKILGLSTHSEAQVREGDAAPVDYLATGPVYATESKPDAETPVGLAGVRRARALTSKPLVAIGGITLDRAAEVRLAGADSVAVISALFGQWARDGDGAALQKLAEDFLHNFR